MSCLPHLGRALLSGSAIIALGSCATLANLAINPQGVVNQTVNETVTSISNLSVDDINNTASGDIERILREHPDAVNRAQLTDLKENLAGQTLASKQAPRDDLQRERAAEHDRRIPRRDRRRTDNVVLEPLTQYQEVPYGIRTTPLSHYPQDGFPPPERMYVTLETDVVRFGR